MPSDSNQQISQRAYELWDIEGRPHGRHHEHWLQAEREFGDGSDAAPTAASNTYPGMMGDGTEEQNLNQPGTPGARITEDELQEAFSDKATR